MALRLGEMLINEGLITREQLDEGLKNQVILGGKLGTNLIEMGALGEEDLAKTLSTKLGVPYVEPDRLMSIHPDVIKALPRGLAENYKVIPIALEKNRLDLVMSDPSDLSAIDEISFVTGFILRPFITPEVRLSLALEKYYHIRRDIRYIRIDERMARGVKSLTAKTPTPQPAANGHEWGDFKGFDDEIVEAEIAEAELLEPEIVEPVPVETRRPAIPVQPPKAAQAPPEAPPRAVQPPPPTEPSEAVRRYTVDAVSEELADAKERDAVAEIILRYVGQEFERVALFIIRGGTIAAGWRAAVKGAPVEGFDALQIKLDLPSVLKTVTEGKSLYLGPIANTPANAEILRILGSGWGEKGCLIPVMLSGRVVNILMVLSSTEIGERLEDLQTLVRKTSMAFEILILRNKILMT
jgi:hypothetical protein